MMTVKLVAVILGLAVVAVSSAWCGDGQSIARPGDQPTFPGSPESFTGDVEVRLLFSPIDGISAGGGMVTFQPGARSFWHTHPAGQQLIILSGEGRTGTWDGAVETVRAGDVVTCPKGVKHWHGASPTTAMTHIAITGDLDGKNVEWLEEVTDEQYNK